jgi:glycosyltransferase involved in cell wall biosynthesis
MGQDVSPAQGLFQEILPGRWFIPNCVDTEQFRRTEPVRDLAVLNPILVPRNLVPRRGLHMAIEAFSKFAPSHPETHLVIVGGYGDPAYRRKLERLADERGVTGRVIFHGHVPWQNMPAVFSSGLMTLVPSLFGEGTSLSALESMACGTSVIATRVGGLLDLPSHNVNPEAADIARAMEDVYGRRDEVGARQEQAVRSTFNLDRWHRAWRDVIRSAD